MYFFVADLHALNGRPDPAALRERSRRLVAALLACGLDRPNVHVYRQSRVPAIAGMAALLGNVTAKGLLNRAHAYKAAVAANVAAGRDPDHGVNMGLYSYPVLMAADILALDADEVPVGADQAQHLEIAVDLAQQFARSYGPACCASRGRSSRDDVATLPGLDGRKMSKSYGNTIALMAEPERHAQADPADRHRLHAARRSPRIPTRARSSRCCVSSPTAATVADVEARYRTGGIGYGEVKALLADAVEAHVAPLRGRYERLLADPAELDARLAGGEQHASRRADRMLARAMGAMGL